MAPRTRQASNSENSSGVRRSSRLKKIQKSKKLTVIKNQAKLTPSNSSKNLKKLKFDSRSEKIFKNSKTIKTVKNQKSGRNSNLNPQNSSPQILEIIHKSSNGNHQTTITTKIQKTPTNIQEFEIIKKMQQEEENLKNELKNLNQEHEIDRDYFSRVQRIEIERNQEFVSRINYFKTHTRHYERIIRTWREVENVLTNRISDENEDINFAERTLMRMVETENGFEFNEE